MSSQASETNAAKVMNQVVVHVAMNGMLKGVILATRMQCPSNN